MIKGSSASLSGEIIVGTGITVTVGLGTTVKDVNRAGGSEISVWFIILSHLKRVEQMRDRMPKTRRVIL